MLTSLPKIELHAHLNGSLCASSIQELQNALQSSCNANKYQQIEDVSKLVVLNDKMHIKDAFRLFGHVHQLTDTPFGLKFATQLVIRDFALDNVIYIELRTTAKDNENMTKKDYLVCVLEAIKNADEVKNGKIHVKLLPSLNRGNPVKEAEEILDIVLELCKSEYSNLIAGLDFSGDPAKGNFKDFIPVLSKAKDYGLPLAIHCAEIENPKEIELMIDFGMQRCGHGTYLNEAQRARLAMEKVPVECCLTSNVLSCTVNNYENHHFKELYEAENPVVLCTDDCGIFNTTLTKEFIIATETFQLNMKDIQKLCENNIQYAFLTTEEAYKLQQQIKSYFKNFE